MHVGRFGLKRNRAVGRLFVGDEVGIGRRHLGADGLSPRVELRRQPLGPLGQAVDQIRVFADVTGKIEQLAPSLLVKLDQFEIAFAYRPARPSALGAVVRIVPIQRVARKLGRAFQQRQNTDAVDRTGKLHAAGRGNRGGQVDGVGRHVARRARLDAAWPADDQVDANAPFVQISFAFAQRRVVRGRQRRGLPARGQPAVVGSEDHECLVGQFQLVELGQDATRALVHALDHGGENRVALQTWWLGRGAVFGDHLGFGLNRRVHGVVRQVEEERPRGIFFQKRFGFIGEPVGDVLAFRRILQARQLATALVRREMALHAAPLEAADRHVETTPLGFEPFAPQVPFTDRRRDVVGPGEQLTQRDLFQRQLPERLGRLHFVFARMGFAGKEIGQADPRGILSRQQRRPGWRTNVTRGVSLRKPHPVGRQPIDVGRLVKPAAVTTQVDPAQIVHENQHHAGFVVRRGRRRGDCRDDRRHQQHGRRQGTNLDTS